MLSAHGIKTWAQFFQALGVVFCLLLAAGFVYRMVRSIFGSGKPVRHAGQPTRTVVRRRVHTRIRVAGPDGNEQCYDSLEDVPPEIRHRIRQAIADRSAREDETPGRLDGGEDGR